MEDDKKSVERWDEAYKVSKSADLWGGTIVPFLKLTLDVFSVSNSNEVVEIPCGDGRNTIPLAIALPNLVAVDTSVNALRLAQRKLDNRGVKNCILMEGDVFDLPFFDKQFDGVFCCDLLGHLREPVPAITEMLRICKPGCSVIGNVFGLGDSTRQDQMEKIGDEEYIYDDKFYFRFYDEQDVSRLLDNFGCKILHLERFRWQEPPHEGYREYVHEHESWVFAIQKRA